MSITSPGAVQNFETRFERTHGVHQFDLMDGTPVTAVSAPSWEEFMDLVNTIKPPECGVVLTPELMTSPYPLDELSDRQGEVMRRTIVMQSYSMRNEGAHVLLGTADFAPSGPHAGIEAPANGLLHIHNGNRQGVAHKRVLSGRSERRIFRPGTAEGYVVGGAIGSIVCADLRISLKNTRYPADNPSHITPTEFPDSVRALLVSSCWAVPLAPHVMQTSEADFQAQLEASVAHTFEAYPNVEEIIMADRQASGVDTQGPFNAHFRRIDL